MKKQDNVNNELKLVFEKEMLSRNMTFYPQN
jgi:hypothetical protein